MPSLTIKGIPEDLLAKLRHRATAHRRSLNSEVLVCLEHSLSPKQIERTSISPDIITPICCWLAARTKIIHYIHLHFHPTPQGVDPCQRLKKF
jgi:hypothetical protein